jgi:hypothetical protein
MMNQLEVVTGYKGDVVSCGAVTTFASIPLKFRKNVSNERAHVW